MKPDLSVILPALLGVETVRAALQAWQCQQPQSRIEIVLLCPDAPEVESVEGVSVVPTGSLLLHEARALGVRSARADYVLMAEDHCLPDPNSLQPVLQLLSEGWDLIGPAMRPGCRRTRAAQASFLLGYGQWMEPVQRGQVRVLPGHNIVIRRQLLLDLGQALETELVMSFFLQRKFRAQGQRFFLEDRWLMWHYDPPSLRKSLSVFWYVGLGCGAVRTRKWPALLRLLYPLALPVAAGRHWLRGAIQYGRAGHAAGIPVSCLPMAALFAAILGIGEAAGSLLGMQRVMPIVAQCEVKPVPLEEVNRPRTHPIS